LSNGLNLGPLSLKAELPTGDFGGGASAGIAPKNNNNQKVKLSSVSIVFHKKDKMNVAIN
jgi:hypothetical protein